MRPLSYRADELRTLLLRNQMATLEELKHALGTSVDVTVFGKLKPLGYLSSYSHRGRYYTLREIARFDDHGLWSQADVWFSRFGTLLTTAEVFVNRSPRGYFADELARALHVEVQDALHQLTQQRRVTREIVSGLSLYTATDRAIQRGQLLTRRTVEAVPTVADASVLEVSEDELKASILLFYSLLDRRVLFTTAMDMLNHLAASQVDHSLIRKLRIYTEPALLIVDELGYLSLDQQSSNLFYQVISTRHSQQRSTVITTNTAFSDWGNVLYNTTIATAIAGRLVENSEIFLLGGDSLRKGNSKSNSPAAE